MTEEKHNIKYDCGCEHELIFLNSVWEFNADIKVCNLHKVAKK